MITAGYGGLQFPERVSPPVEQRKTLLVCNRRAYAHPLLRSWAIPCFLRLMTILSVKRRIAVMHLSPENQRYDSRENPK
jgi:hypothetical protein